MKLKYLGTAAAEAIPALFCECEVCRKSRAKGGRHFRTRSQALLDGTVLLDFPCDTAVHMMQNGLSLLNIPYCLITHVHSDHFAPSEMAYIRKGYATVLPERFSGFRVFGSEDLAPALAPVTEQSPDRIFYTQVEPYKPFPVGDYRVTALRAHHGTPHPYNYLIERDGKALLYAHDTSTFLPETWDYLAAHPVRLSLVSLDCTIANRERPSSPTSTHMCLPDNIATRERLTALGLTDEKTVFVLNHFSHNGPDSDYDTFRPIGEANGFLVSYDGMEVEF